MFSSVVSPRRVDTRSRRTRAALAVAGALVAGCTVTGTMTAGPGYPPAPGLEWNTNRFGADYRGVELVNPDPELCRATCMNEPQCLAFTFVGPGVQGPTARCWLKNQVPPPAPDPCCVSGTKYGGAPPPPATLPPPSSWQGAPAPPPPSASPPPVARQWEPETDRPGMDYKHFDLSAPQPEVCRDACWRDGPCRAFTYVRPGAQGPNARCALKSGVPPARPADCCLSGVK